MTFIVNDHQQSIVEQDCQQGRPTHAQQWAFIPI